MTNAEKINFIKKGKLLSPFDIVAIVTAVILALSFIGFSYAVRERGNYITIRLVGTVTDCASVLKLEYSPDNGNPKMIEIYGGSHTLPLNKNATITVFFPESKIKTIRIEYDAVKILYTHCLNQICRHAGAVRYAGQSIKCIPKRLIITVIGHDAFDGVLG